MKNRAAKMQFLSFSRKRIFAGKSGYNPISKTFLAVASVFLKRGCGLIFRTELRFFREVYFVEIY